MRQFETDLPEMAFCLRPRRRGHNHPLSSSVAANPVGGSSVKVTV